MHQFQHRKVRVGADPKLISAAQWDSWKEDLGKNVFAMKNK